MFFFFFFVNSANHEMSRSVAFHLGLHCLRSTRDVFHVKIDLSNRQMTANAKIFPGTSGVVTYFALSFMLCTD